MRSAADQALDIETVIRKAAATLEPVQRGLCVEGEDLLYAFRAKGEVLCVYYDAKGGRTATRAGERYELSPASVRKLLDPSEPDGPLWIAVLSMSTMAEAFVYSSAYDKDRLQRLMKRWSVGSFDGETPWIRSMRRGGAWYVEVPVIYTKGCDHDVLQLAASVDAQGNVKWCPGPLRVLGAGHSGACVR